MRLLVVEGHPTLGPDLKKGLENCGYNVDLVNNGEDALAQSRARVYNLIILDVPLTHSKKQNLSQQLRAYSMLHRCQWQGERGGLGVPILYLTALDKADQQREKQDLDADEYLVKPFAFRELEARVRTMLAQGDAEGATVLHFMDITMDTKTHTVQRGQRTIELSRKEYALLRFFMHYPRHVVSRMMIAEHVWDYDANQMASVVDVYIRYLRSKLCAEGEPDVIQSVSGAGYQLKESMG